MGFLEKIFGDINEKEIKKSLEQNTYNALIRAGLGSTLLEGENDYFFQK